jgi:hypothetical protein
MTVLRKLSTLAIGAVVSAATACSGAHPTAPDTILPRSPSFDGGGWTGSGSRIEQQDSTAAPVDFEGSADTGWMGGGGRSDSSNLTLADTAATNAAPGTGWAGSGN